MSKRPHQEPATPASREAELTAEIAALRAEVHKLTSHRFMRIQNSFWKLLFYQLTNGLMVGLGTVLGATILVSFVAYSLSQIELVPIIGEYATKIIQQIKEQQAP
jgi:ABC-type maltose transport system permease subunit